MLLLICCKWFILCGDYLLCLQYEHWALHWPDFMELLKHKTAQHCVEQVKVTSQNTLWICTIFNWYLAHFCSTENLSSSMKLSPDPFHGPFTPNKFVNVLYKTTNQTVFFILQKKNYERIQQSLDSFITIREMLAAGSSSDVKKRMDGQDVLAYPLLQWWV